MTVTLDPLSEAARCLSVGFRAADERGMGEMFACSFLEAWKLGMTPAEAYQYAVCEWDL